MLPVLAEAAATVAGPGHRTVATLGGNLCLDTRCVFYNQSEWWRRANDFCLKHGGDVCHVAPQGKHCHAAFSGDLAPALLVLDATIEIVGPAGARRLPLAELYVDDGARHLALAPGEIVAAVRIPAQPASARTGYRKARARGAIDFPLAGVAARVEMNDGRLARTARRADRHQLAAVPARRHRCARRRRAVTDETLAQLGKLVQKQVSPMRTTVTHSNYRRQVAAVLAQRLVRELAAEPVAGARGTSGEAERARGNRHGHLRKCLRPRSPRLAGATLDRRGWHPRRRARPRSARATRGDRQLLESIGDATTPVIVHHERDPVMLYGELAERGWTVERVDAGPVKCG